MGVQLGLGVRPTAVTVEIGQGALAATGGDLDFAIEGAGYFEVTLPDGRAAYTRDGALKITGDGLVVTSDGYAVAPEITIPPTHSRSRSIRRARSGPTLPTG